MFRRFSEQDTEAMRSHWEGTSIRNPTNFMKNTVLGIDPGTRDMGIAVLAGDELVAYGVHTLRNGHRPYDVIGQARKIVLMYVAKYNPSVVSLEKPLRMSHKRAALLTTIVEELSARTRDLQLEVVQLQPSEIRQELLGNPRANKLQVAETIVENGFEELREKLPQKPKRSALGYRPKEMYWFHMFDALAAALATQGAALRTKSSASHT